MSRKTIKGIVASNKTPKTLVVRVSRLKQHPKYKKYREVSKRYKAHYEEGQYQIGEEVVIEETRPTSRDKRWRVKGLVKKSEPQGE